MRLVGPTPGGRRASLTRLPHRAFWTYDAAVSISDELARARQLTYAADETSARDLLLSLIPQIEQEDRDDLMLEVLAQLGEIYLARGANDGVQESIQRIDDCLASYPGADADAHMICRYSRRAHFLRTGLAAAQGDHDGAAAALQNGEVNVLYGQASADTVKALAGLKNVTSTTTPTACRPPSSCGRWSSSKTISRIRTRRPCPGASCTSRSHGASRRR